MKDYKKTTTILLSIVIVLGVAAIGILGYQIFTNNQKPIVPDFSNYTETQIEEWCESIEDNPCVIKHEYSDVVTKGAVLYQSIAPEEKLDGVITITISDGKMIIDLIKYTNETTKEEVESWST